MDEADAVAMIAGADVAAPGPTTWADLGCGDGTFTRALAALLAPGSTIHAMDRDASALRALPSTHHGIPIHAHRGDFTRQPWPFDGVQGILMANALHYVADGVAFIRACASRSSPPPRFVIVEYDTDRASPWVPYPVGRERLRTLFEAAGYASIRMLASRPSIYRSAPLYAAVVDAVAAPAS